MTWQIFLAVPVIGAVPDDEDIVISANQGEPLADTNSLAGEAYFNICRRISGESVPLMDLDPHKGILVGISRLFEEGIGGGADENAWKIRKE